MTVLASLFFFFRFFFFLFNIFGFLCGLLGKESLFEGGESRLLDRPVGLKSWNDRGRDFDKILT